MSLFRPYLPGPLRVHSTIDLVKQFCHIPSSSSSSGSDVSEGSEDISSLSLLGHKQEAVEFCKLITAFSGRTFPSSVSFTHVFPSLSGPLSGSVSSGSSSFDSRVTSFIQYHVKRPTSCCLSDNYFADDGTPAKAAVSREGITSSEQLLWSLLQIMSENNGNVRQ